MHNEKATFPRKSIRIRTFILLLAAIALLLLMNPDFFNPPDADAQARYISERIQQEEMSLYAKGETFTSELSHLFQMETFRKNFPDIRTWFQRADEDRFSVSVYHADSPTGRVFTVRSPTPLFLASIRGDIEKAQEWIGQGFDVDEEYQGRPFCQEDPWGCCTTPLHCAARYGHTGIVDLLMRRRAEKKPYGQSGYSLLQTATHYGHVDLVKTLLKSREDFHTRPTLLYLAAEAGHRELLNLFLSLDIDPNEETDKGKTALSAAIENDHPAVARDLLTCGADPGSGMKAAIEKENRDWVKELIGHGADVNGETYPLLIAASRGAVQIADLLLAHGARVDGKTGNGNTALHLAAGKDSPDMVQLLVARGADVNAVNRFGDTPLARAAGAGSLEIVRFLVDSGAKANTAPRTNTPLHRAIRGGHPKIARYLVQKGADINALNVAGKRPLEAAIRQHEWRIAFFLFHRGASY